MLRPFHGSKSSLFLTLKETSERHGVALAKSLPWAEFITIKWLATTDFQLHCLMLSTEDFTRHLPTFSRSARWGVGFPLQ